MADLLTASEVSRVLGVSKHWVAEHSAGRANVRRPVLPCVRLGKAIRYRPEDIDDFIEMCRALVDRKAG